MSWFVGETSLFGLNRILLGRTKVIRFMWIPFFGLMVVGLIITSIVSLEQYLNRVTVYQTTFSNTFEGGFPDITVCLEHDTAVKYFYGYGQYYFKRSSSKNEFYPWLKEPDAVRSLGEMANETGITKSRVFVNSSKYSWIGRRSESPYHRNFQGYFRVDLSSTLPELDITILENVPRKHNFLCVTFQIHSKKLIVFDSIDLSCTLDAEEGGLFRVILSEQNTYSAEFDKETIMDLEPYQINQVFFRRVMRTILDTGGCHPPTDTVGLYGHRYNYTQGGCIEQRLHDQVETACHCRNTNHILGSAQQPCNQSCVDQQPVVNIRDVAKQCGPLCRSNRLAIEGISTEMRYTAGGAYKSQVELIMTRNVQIEMETEIYTLTKFLSEVGGFSSLFIGFSLAFVFEVLEAIGLYFTSKCKRLPSKVNDHATSEVEGKQEIFTIKASNF